VVPVSSSQKRKGTAFESSIRNYLNASGFGVERTIAGASEDRGDLHGLRVHGDPVVVECKNHRRMELAQWVDEACAEAENAGAPIGVVVHKKRGVTYAGDQYVTMRLCDFVWLVEGFKEETWTSTTTSR
jgi:hypothetical protein